MKRDFEQQTDKPIAASSTNKLEPDGGKKYWTDQLIPRNVHCLFILGNDVSPLLYSHIYE